MSGLSDRYRRLLRWYPRDHRDDHEEEMLGVLMAAARPGQTRPTPREAGDLVRGGLRIRAARAVARAAGTGWRDALAVAGVLVPLAMSLNVVRFGLAWWFGPPDGLPFLRLHPDWSAWAVWPLVAVLALCFGARRTAGVAAAAAMAWWAVIAGDEYLHHDATAAVVAVWWPLLGLVAVAGLAAGPGPRQGVRILRRNRTLSVAAGLLLAAWAFGEVLPYLVFAARLDGDTFAAVGDGAGGLAVVAASVLALVSPVGRRLAVLLSMPVTGFAVLYEAGDGGPWSNHSAVELLPVIPVTLGVFVAAAVSLGPAERVLRLIRRGGW